MKQKIPACTLFIKGSRFAGMTAIVIPDIQSTSLIASSRESC
jgi:hypothetical protein